MSAQRNDLNPHILIVPIGTQAASINLPGPVIPKHSKIMAISYLDQAGISADNTNFLQVSLKVAGSAVATLDTRAAHDGAVTALVAKTLAQTGEIDVPAASQMEVDITKNGTGVPTLAFLQIELYPL